MVIKKIIWWVEGPHDKIFFENIIKPHFENEEVQVNILIYNGDEYKSKKNKKLISNKIKSFDLLDNYDYLFFHDYDTGPTFNDVKNEIKKIIPTIDPNKIVIVQKVIEGWYFAGINNAKCREWKLNLTIDTNTLSKNRFNRMIPHNLRPKRNFLIEITKIYDKELAKNKNNSLKSFSRSF